MMDKTKAILFTNSFETLWGYYVFAKGNYNRVAEELLLKIHENCTDPIQRLLMVAPNRDDMARFVMAINDLDLAAIKEAYTPYWQAICAMREHKWPEFTKTQSPYFKDWWKIRLDWPYVVGLATTLEVTNDSQMPMEHFKRKILDGVPATCGNQDNFVPVPSDVIDYYGPLWEMVCQFVAQGGNIKK